jgi:hypothetical protein
MDRYRDTDGIEPRRHDIILEILACQLIDCG